VDHSIVRIPATCPMCGQEYLVGLELETLSDRLATGRSIKLYCNCERHSVTWVANEVERSQIREYTAAVQFFAAEKGQRTRPWWSTTSHP
jgi:hypothetical protein